MNFTEALEKVYKTTKNKRELNNPMIVFSRISDMVGNSYEDKKKAETFLKLLEEINLFMLFSELREKGLNRILCRYNDVSELLSKDAYEKIVYIVFVLIFPKQKQLMQNNNNQNVKKAQIIKAPSLGQPSKRTPLKQMPNKQGNINKLKPKPQKKASSKTVKNSNKGTIIVSSICGIIGFVFGWLVFGSNASWTFWQWLIGVLGGALLAVICVLTVMLIDGWLICEYYKLGSFVLLFILISNFVLQCIFLNDYKVIFCWISGYEILCGLGLSFLSFDDVEDKWGIFQLCETGLIILLLIIGLIV